MRPVRIGTRTQWQVVPDANHTAAKLGNEGVEVVASPFLIGFLEQTCHVLTEPHYEAGERTVGVGFELKHLAAAETGRPIDCTAELVSQEGRRLRFAVEARQDDRVVMAGHHERHLIDQARFGKSPDGSTEAQTRSEATRKANGPTLTFWFDLHSPWCYLAALRIGALARRRCAALDWRPISLPRLIESIDGRRLLDENSAFVGWFKQDLLDWAEMAGIEIRYHPDYPLRNGRALRVCALAASQGKAEAVAQRLFRAYWGEAGDITDPAKLGAWASEAGLDAAAATAAAGDAHWKEVVEANTRAAIDAGVFGVPSVLAEDKLFFGNDRLDLLERFLSRKARSSGP